MAESVRFLLSEHERTNPVWVKIKKHLEGRLDLLRSMNDKHHDAETTARLRGRIREVKELAALDNPAPQMEADDLFKD